MDALAYWRFDNYRCDLDDGAGFHFNSKQSRLHTVLNLGETLWLFTRVVGESGLSEYRILAKLVIRAKTINPPNYKYGPFRVWGDFKHSQYFQAAASTEQDAFELLRVLPLDSGSFGQCERSSLAQAAQTIRGFKPEASRLLQAFCDQLPVEPRAMAVADEMKLERALTAEPTQLVRILEEEHRGVSASRREELSASYSRNRQLVAELNRMYDGRCVSAASNSKPAN